jgi:hypothetical protein
MAITSNGYDGTVDEVQWAKLASSLGTRDGVGGEGDLLVTAVAGLDRTVAIAAGTAYGHGILDTNSASFNVQLTTLGSGTRWDTIVVRRDWQPPTGISTLTYVTGTATQAIAAAVNNNPGVISDQVLALVQITAGVQAPTAVVDLRTWPSKVVYATTLPAASRYAYGTVLLVNGQMYTRRTVATVPAWVSENAPAWTAVSLATGAVAAIGTNPMQYRVVVDRIEFRGSVARSDGAAWTSGTGWGATVIGSIPSSDAPTQNRSWVQGLGGREVIAFALSTTGVITMTWPSGLGSALIDGSVPR